MRRINREMEDIWDDRVYERMQGLPQGSIVECKDPQHLTEEEVDAAFRKYYGPKFRRQAKRMRFLFRVVVYGRCCGWSIVVRISYDRCIL